MSIHAVLCFVTLVIAYFCWHSFVLHTLWLFIILHVSIWNGARYYFKVAMNPEKIMKQLNKENEKEKEREEKELELELDQKLK